MSASETSSSQRQSLRQWSSAALKETIINDEERLKLMGIYDEKLPPGNTVAEKGRGSITPGISSEPFVAITVPHFLGNSLVERTTLTKSEYQRRLIVEQTENSGNLGVMTSESSAKTLTSLLSHTDNMLTTIISTYSLSAESVTSYNKGNETGDSILEVPVSCNAVNATDLSGKLFSSSYGFNKYDSISDKEIQPAYQSFKLNGAYSQNNVTDNDESFLERGKIRLSVKDDAAAYGADATRNLITDYGEDCESESLLKLQLKEKELTRTSDNHGIVDYAENQSRKPIILKCAELNRTKDVIDYSISTTSNSSITQAFKKLAGSASEQTKLTSLIPEKVRISLSTLQPSSDSTSQETQASLSDSVQLHNNSSATTFSEICKASVQEHLQNVVALNLLHNLDAKSKVRESVAELSKPANMQEADARHIETENEKLPRDYCITAEATLVPDNASAPVSSHGEDNVRTVTKQQQSELVQTSRSLLPEVNVLKRRLLVACEAVRNGAEIIWLLLKGLYALLNIIFTTSGRAVRLFAMMLLFVQTIYQLIISQRKHSCTPNMEGRNSLEEASSITASQKMGEVTDDKKIEDYFHESKFPNSKNLDLHSEHIFPEPAINDVSVSVISGDTFKEDPNTYSAATFSAMCEASAQLHLQSEVALNLSDSLSTDKSERRDVAELLELVSTQDAADSDHEKTGSIIGNETVSAEESPSCLSLLFTEDGKVTPPILHTEQSFLEPLFQPSFEDISSCVESYRQSSFSKKREKYFFTNSEYGFTPSDLEKTNSNSKVDYAESAQSYVHLVHWSEYSNSNNSNSEQIEKHHLKTETFRDTPKCLPDKVPNEEKCAVIKQPSFLKEESQKDYQMSQNECSLASGAFQTQPTTRMKEDLFNKETEKIYIASISEGKEKWDSSNNSGGTRGISKPLQPGSPLLFHDKILSMNDSPQRQTLQVSQSELAKSSMRENEFDDSFNLRGCNVEIGKHALLNENLGNKIGETATLLGETVSVTTPAPYSFEGTMSSRKLDCELTPSFGSQNGTSNSGALYSPYRSKNTSANKRRRLKCRNYYFPNLSAPADFLHRQERHNVGLKKRPLTVTNWRDRKKIFHLSLENQTDSWSDLLIFPEHDHGSNIGNIKNTATEETPTRTKVGSQGATPYRETRASMLRKAKIKEKLKLCKYFP